MLEAGPELDALVSEKVMGIKLRHYPTGRHASTPEDYADAEINVGWHGWMWEGREDAGPWHPSRDIGAAWEIVELLADRGISLSIHYGVFAGEWTVAIGPVRASAQTAPLAICQAALMVFEAA